MISEESLFAEAIELPTQERKAYLDRVCEADSSLRERMERLLLAHEQTDPLLDFEESAEDGASDRLNVDVGQDIGPYRLLQKLGEGGFGVVFMAEQRAPVRRQVALKVIKPGMDSRSVVARFEAERQALAMMDHPNIAKVFDGGTVSDSNSGSSVQRPYFVMELVRGVPITEYCDANSLSTAERMQLFVSVCHAVHHAHQKGVIHRDIKPSNVMVTLHDGEPVVKVIDFGVAKALHQRLTEKTLFTQYGMMVGTPQYMSPEQAEISGLDVDTRSDVYSLAVLLYELMTGTTPLEAKSLRTAGYQELQRMIREEEPPKPSQRVSSSGAKLTVLAKHRSVSPSQLPREISGDLDWIVMKGLEKDRRRRYDTASDFAADIQRALKNEPVHAGPPSALYRTKKFLLRHRSQVFAAALLLAVVGLVGGAAWQTQRLRKATQQQNDSQLSRAVDDATAMLLSVNDSTPNDDRWDGTDLLVSRVRELSLTTQVSAVTAQRTHQFLKRYEAARRDREFVLAMEELLVQRATQNDLASWTAMETEFREILRQRGYDVDRESPADLGERIHDDPTNVKLTDALELWIGTRQHLADLGGPALTSEEKQTWIDAMCVSDPDPLRAVIRQIVYSTESKELASLDNAVAESDLTQACARKLSWLSESYAKVGDPSRSEEVLRLALARYPDDLMLNFEHAQSLMSEEQWERAIRYLMRCTAIRPEIPGVWETLAEALRQNGELDAAEHALQVAVDCRSDSFLSNQAISLRDQG
ncbi:protein kinase [Rhodopirellula sp. JC740]|uniref:Protein kinase n=1 Tax=Rhodopirellula halodulae TaxID=2894198 RepID=A0ABS8NP46_9BACT|nr:serine/threonine-protein kinase [Rhodopirellula sp. JC740]MCC9645353.1 protein kinase [Rhodopirellula sp. JC740]